MYSYSRWADTFGDQVSKIREQRTGRVTLLYNAEIDELPGMEDALYDCWRERVKPRDAAIRYVRLHDAYAAAQRQAMIRQLVVEFEAGLIGIDVFARRLDSIGATNDEVEQVLDATELR